MMNETYRFAFDITVHVGSVADSATGAEPINHRASAVSKAPNTLVDNQLERDTRRRVATGVA
jgi:hypothetical protein